MLDSMHAILQEPGLPETHIKEENFSGD